MFAKSRARLWDHTCLPLSSLICCVASYLHDDVFVDFDDSLDLLAWKLFIALIVDDDGFVDFCNSSADDDVYDDWLVAFLMGEDDVLFPFAVKPWAKSWYLFAGIAIDKDEWF